MGSKERNPLLNKKRFAIKNTTIFILWYLLLFSGFWSLSDLQSTINSDDGVGSKSQALLYACSALSALFLPRFLLDKLGCKNVLLIGTLSCCLFEAANIYPGSVLLAASAIFGLVNGVFVVGQPYYVDTMANEFLSKDRINQEAIKVCFLGVYSMGMQVSIIIGNSISFLALLPSEQQRARIKVYLKNGTNCGVKFDADEHVLKWNQMFPQSLQQRWTLIGTLLSMGLVSALFLAFLLDDPGGDDDEKNADWTTVFNQFLSSIRHLRKYQQLVLVPLSIYIGMETTFYANEVTQAYIACSWGVHHVGFVTVCFGVCGAITALLVGPLVKYFSQMAVILLAACANLSTCIFLFFWQPTPDAPYTYFIVAGVWGMGDAIWWSQVTALYGLMFPDDREAAFSNLYFWSFLGFFLSYSYANYFSVAVKMYILLTFLTTGILGYLIGQIRIRCASRTQYVAIDQDEQ